MASAIAADETQQCLSPRAEIWNRGDTLKKNNKKKCQCTHQDKEQEGSVPYVLYFSSIVMMRNGLQRS